MDGTLPRHGKAWQSMAKHGKAWQSMTGFDLNKLKVDI